MWTKIEALLLLLLLTENKGIGRCNVLYGKDAMADRIDDIDLKNTDIENDF